MSAAVPMERSEILNSWKEIAAYLNRTVRTVQRWETAGLPVHRPSGTKRSVVVALRPEIDHWLLRAPLDLEADAPPPRRARNRIHEYTSQTRLLSGQLKSSTNELATTLQRLMDNIEQMSKIGSPYLIGSAEDTPNVENIVRSAPRPGFDRTPRPA